MLHVTCILIGEVFITSNCMMFELHSVCVCVCVCMCVCVCARAQMLLDVLTPVEDQKISQLISFTLY